MFKLLAKNALYVALFKRYRKGIIRIILCLIALVATHFIYSDLTAAFESTQQLKCTALVGTAVQACIDQMEWAKLYALIGKWLINIVAIAYIIFTLNPLSKKSDKTTDTALSDSQETEAEEPSKTTECEETLASMTKKQQLKSGADIIWDKLKR